MPLSVRDIADAASRVAVAFQGAPVGMPAKIWQQLSPWMQRLILSASNKALPYLVTGGVCEVPVYDHGEEIGPCGNAPVARCDICGRTCCLEHCRIDQHWDAVCYLCLMELAASKRGGATGPDRWHQADSSEPDDPGPEQQKKADRAAVRAAYRLLGVRMDATDEVIKAALRQKLAASHPDRARGPKAKERAEKRFKEIQDAFRVIERSRSKEAA